MNKNNFLLFPRHDGKSSKEMLSLFNKYCNSQTTITAGKAIDFVENQLKIKLLNYQKVFLKNFWDGIKVGDVDLEKGVHNKYVR